MKNFADLTLEVLSSEELMAVRGGIAPTDPIIIREALVCFATKLSISTIKVKK